MDAVNYITCDSLRDNLYREDEMLLLDCRSNDEYRVGHITGSHNVVLPQLMMRRLKTNKLHLKNLVPPNYMQDKEAFLEKWTSHQVVIYDHFSSEVSSNDTTMVHLVYKRFIDEGCSAFILKGNYF